MRFVTDLLFFKQLLKNMTDNLKTNTLTNLFPAHTQAKKHQANLMKRAYEQTKNVASGPTVAPGQITPKIAYKKFIKIGIGISFNR